MTIGRICQRDVCTVDPGGSLRDAARRMTSEHVHTLVVLGDAGQPAGLLTDRALTLQALDEDLDPDGTRVEDVMNPDPPRLPESSSMSDALEWMKERELRRLVVVEEDGTFAGLVTLDDVLRLMADEMVSFGRRAT